MVTEHDKPTAAASRPEFLDAQIVDEGRPVGGDGPLWRRLPWGGALALALVLVVEGLVLAPAAPFGPWDEFLVRLGDSHPLERGLTLDRLVLDRAAVDGAPGASRRPRVTLVGTSRTDAAFQPELLADEFQPPIDFYEMAHARVFPHELRSMLPEVLSTRPDLLVSVLSELEFFMPLKVVPKARGPSWSALIDFADRVGWRFLLSSRERRELLLRSAAVCLSPTYRYRSVLDKTVFGVWRRFPMGQDGSLVTRVVTWPPLIADGQPLALSPERLTELRTRLDEFYVGKARNVAVQYDQIRSLRNGEHAAIKMAMLEEVFAQVRAAGAEVLVLYGLIQPLAEPLYDRAAGQQVFDAWIERVAADPGIHYLPFEAVGEFGPNDFRDLTHVNKQGALKYTVAIMDKAARLLTPAWHEALEERIKRDG